MEALLQAAARSRTPPASLNDEGPEAAAATPAAAEAEVEAGPLGVARLLLSPGVRAPFGLGCALMFFQQFSGINAVIFYSASILQAGGIDDPNQGGLLIMGVQVLMTAVPTHVERRARCDPK